MQIQPTESFGVARFLQLEQTVKSLSINVEKLVAVSCDHGERLRELYEKLHHSATKIELSTALGNTRVTLQKWQNKFDEQNETDRVELRDSLLSAFNGRLSEYVKKTRLEADQERASHELNFLKSYLSDLGFKLATAEEKLALSSQEGSIEIAELKLKIGELEQKLGEFSVRINLLSGSARAGINPLLRNALGGSSGSGSPVSSRAMLHTQGSKSSFQQRHGSHNRSSKASLHSQGSQSSLRGGHHRSSKAALHSHGSKAALHSQGSKSALHSQGSKASLPTYMQQRRSSLSSHQPAADQHAQDDKNTRRRSSLSSHQPTVIPAREEMPVEPPMATTSSLGEEDEDKEEKEDEAETEKEKEVVGSLVAEEASSEPDVDADTKSSAMSPSTSAMHVPFTAIDECEDEDDVEEENAAPAPAPASSAPPAEECVNPEETTTTVPSDPSSSPFSIEEKEERENEVAIPDPSTAASTEDAALVETESVVQVHTQSQDPTEEANEQRQEDLILSRAESIDDSDIMEFTMPPGGFGESRSRSGSGYSESGSVAESGSGSGSGSGSQTGSYDSFEALREDVVSAQELMWSRLGSVEVALGGGAHRVDDLLRRNDKIHEAVSLLDAEHTALLAAHKAACQERAVSEASLFATLEHVVSISSVLQAEMSRHETQLLSLSKKMERGLVAAPGGLSSSSSAASIQQRAASTRHAPLAGPASTTGSSSALRAGSSTSQSNFALGGGSRKSLGLLPIVEGKEERLLEGFAAHELTVPSLVSMKDLLTNLSGQEAKPEEEDEFGLKDGSSWVAAGSKSAGASAKELAKLKEEVLQEVELLPSVQAGVSKADALSAKVGSVQEAVKRLEGEQAQLALSYGSIAQELALLKRVMRAHSLSLAKRHATAMPQIVDVGAKAAVTVAAAAAVAAGITAPAAPPGLKRRAPFARGSAHTKPTKDEQRDVDKEDRVQKSIEFREAQALLSEYLGDERVDGVGVTPQFQAVTKLPPPSKVRQAFERKLPPDFVKKPESPIKYPGENLWSRASEAQLSHRDSSESALERYLLEFGYDLPEDP